MNDEYYDRFGIKENPMYIVAIGKTLDEADFYGLFERLYDARQFTKSFSSRVRTWTIKIKLVA